MPNDKKIEEIKKEKIEAQQKAVEEIKKIMIDNDLELKIEHLIHFVSK